MQADSSSNSHVVEGIMNEVSGLKCKQINAEMNARDFSVKKGLLALDRQGILLLLTRCSMARTQ